MTHEDDEHELDRDDAETEAHEDENGELEASESGAMPKIDTSIFITPALRDSIERMRIDASSYQTPAMRDAMKRITDSQLPKGLKEAMQNLVKSQVQLAGLEEMAKRHAPRIKVPDLMPQVNFPAPDLDSLKPDFGAINVEPVSPIGGMDHLEEVAETARKREEREEAMLQAAIETRDATIIAAQALQAQSEVLVELTDHAGDQAESTRALAEQADADAQIREKNKWREPVSITLVALTLVAAVVMPFVANWLHL